MSTFRVRIRSWVLPSSRATGGEVSSYAQSFQAYSDEEYRSLLTDCAFDRVEFFASLAGAAGESPGDLIAIESQVEHGLRTESKATWICLG